MSCFLFLAPRLVLIRFLAFGVILHDMIKEPIELQIQLLIFNPKLLLISFQIYNRNVFRSHSLEATKINPSNPSLHSTDVVAQP